MPTNINTLVPDIEYYIHSNEDWLGHVEDLLYSQRSQPHRRDNSKRSGLRLSGLGDKCPRQLWYSLHHPDLAETLPAAAKFKYGYGHKIEEMIVALAKLSGHSVTGEQDELVVDGIVGHRDCVVDGCVLDVKSCSSIAFKKYKEGSLAQSDDFGYLYQLGSYILGSANDPLVTVKDRGYFFFVDKSLGHMYLYECRPDETKIRYRISETKRISRLSEAPECRCGVIRDKQTGHYKLDLQASYSAYKSVCFPQLRTEIISGKPVYFI